MPTSFFLQQAASLDAGISFWQIIAGVVVTILSSSTFGGLITFWLMRRQRQSAIGNQDAGTAKTKVEVVKGLDDLWERLHSLHGTVSRLENENKEKDAQLLAKDILIQRLKAGEAV